MRPRTILLAALLSLVPTVLPAAEDHGPWYHDLAAAQAEAKASHRDVLLVFIGKGWSRWCQRLLLEVLDTPEFLKKAKLNYVLARCDIPAPNLPPQPDLPAAKVRARYGIHAYPTVLLTTAEGVPYGRANYRSGGVPRYWKLLTELRSGRDELLELLAREKTATGTERAQVLDALAAAKRRNGLPVPIRVYQEILRLDPDNAEGLHAKHAERVALDAVQQAIGAAGQAKNAGPTIIALLEKALQNPVFTPRSRQQLRYSLSCQRAQAGDFDGAKEELRAAQELLPESPLAQSIPEMLKQLDQARDAKEAKAEQTGSPHPAPPPPK